MIKPEKARLDEGIVRIKLYFQGYYGEPPVEFDINLADVSTTKNLVVTMAYDPMGSTKKWSDIKFS